MSRFRSTDVFGVRILDGVLADIQKTYDSNFGLSRIKRVSSEGEDGDHRAAILTALGVSGGRADATSSSRAAASGVFQMSLALEREYC